MSAKRQFLLTLLEGIGQTLKTGLKYDIDFALLSAIKNHLICIRDLDDQEASETFNESLIDGWSISYIPSTYYLLTRVFIPKRIPCTELIVAAIVYFFAVFFLKLL